MHQPDERYYQLAEKWLNGTITPEERKEFTDWYNAGQDAPLDIPSQFAISEEALRQRIFHRIRTRQRMRKLVSTKKIAQFLQTANVGPSDEPLPAVPVNSNRLWKIPITRIAAASVVAISLGVGIYYLTRHSGRSPQPPMPIARTEAPAIRPGNDKAVLTLGDGSNVVLDTAGKGMITKEHGSRIMKMDDGRLAYEVVKGSSNTTAYDILSTPRGGKYSIVLADGTKVWLNSASSLRFPTAFNGKQRRVELKGEGYFEVAKNTTMPFIISTSEGSEIEVLGTHFNIMAYDDEGEERTTLLEGAVRVRKSDASVVLSPGQQSWLERNQPSLHVIKDADVEEAIAWRNGLFQFGQTDMRSIMRQLARWYDVDVSYDQDIPGHFSGTISRNADLEKVLHMLELTGSVHFTIRGRQVLVHK
jgi:ferric-dicitrate binding protein FerR (iron transport regulator)